MKHTRLSLLVALWAAVVTSASGTVSNEGADNAADRKHHHRHHRHQHGGVHLKSDPEAQGEAQVTKHPTEVPITASPQTEAPAEEESSVLDSIGDMFGSGEGENETLEEEAKKQQEEEVAKTNEEFKKDAQKDEEADSYWDDTEQEEHVLRANAAGRKKGAEGVPAEPYEYLYTEADAVARDVEMRKGASFFPEGTEADVDLSVLDKFEMNTFFNQDPSVFGNCLLVRDFAEPFRVGTSLVKTATKLRGKDWKPKHGDQPRKSSKQSIPRAPPPKGPHARRISHLGLNHTAPAHWPSFAQLPDLDLYVAKARNLSQNHSLNGTTRGNDQLPDDELLAVGAISDRDAVKDKTELGVNAFAFLRSVAGEVAVIANGYVSKWSSKKKVPIAGYLCTTPVGPVLHTLPTPCVPTAIDEQGLPYPPPVQMPAPPQGLSSPAPAPMAGSYDFSNPSPSPSPGPAQPSPPPPPAAFHVWVGSQRLEFKTKRKAHRFCTRLANRIANDPGDTEWDTDKIAQEHIKPDMTATYFQQLARKAEVDWTTGTKSLLVVIMDWQAGDKSKAPFTSQTLAPQHYVDNIMPRVREAFQDMSYGKFDISVTVAPEVMSYSRPRSIYASEGYPFPGLYNGARETMAGNGDYNFDSYDLVYVVAPQQAPTGTKGVAWVGAKGAMCNGCETLSDNFQVMVAVHELGHNLGLWHASSKSLEYGNVFDWMGNYPDVQGLSYGLGYKLALGWLPQAAVRKVSDSNIAGLNEEVMLVPFDIASPPLQGQLVGVRIRLKKNNRDLWISYRHNVEKKGVYIFWMTRDKPDSELIDMGCHSPSQRDSGLNKDWTYVDPSSSIVITTMSVDASAARVHIYEAPKGQELKAIQARDTFTDGNWKCPRTCTDSDLLLSNYQGCEGLAQKGYCKGATITMNNEKYNIGEDLCPVACGLCSSVEQGGTLNEKGCADKNVVISGMDCKQVAAGGYCNYNTNIGHVGDSLCPMSCGRCPAQLSQSTTSGPKFEDPKPQKIVGQGMPSIGTAVSFAADPPLKERLMKELREEEKEEAEADEEDAYDDETEEEEEAAKGDQLCTDDLAWTDKDGEGCAIYKQAIIDKKMTRKEACEYDNGAAKAFCRRTCNSCDKTDASTCVDKQCVTKWRLDRSVCYACSDWKGMCDWDFFRHDCPKTCGVCKSSGPETTGKPATTIVPPTTTEPPRPPSTPPPEAPPTCHDHDCVDSWLESFGTCYKCHDYAETYCGRDSLFMQSCPKSCKICSDQELDCHDDFLEHTCKRYQRWGWCAYEHASSHCKDTCGICAEIAAHKNLTRNGTAEKPHLPSGAMSKASPSVLAVLLMLSTSLLQSRRR